MIRMLAFLLLGAGVYHGVFAIDSGKAISNVVAQKKAILLCWQIIDRREEIRALAFSAGM